MGEYPIGTQTFKTLIERGMVYVDKTDLVYELAQKRVCFLSRPRRFGKSLTLSTLKSYFKGEKQWFSGLKIEQLDQDWKVYPVLHLDFSNGNYRSSGGLENVLEDVLNLWELQYGKMSDTIELGRRFQHVIKKARESTGMEVVVLIDEYDKPLLDVLGEPVEQQNRDILRGFYGTFKAADEHLRFVMMTGVTKFSQVSVFSGFNQPENISMDNRFDALCGITEEELHAYFDDEMAAMAEEQSVSKDEMYRLFKHQYDGYHFSEKMLDAYNPFSVINAFSKRRMDNFWFASGTPTYLMHLIDRNKVNVQQMLGRTYEKEYFMDYKADSEDPLAMIYQSGYLTIKGYNPLYKEFSLDFPNEEVRHGFLTLLANDYLQTKEPVRSLVVGIDKMLRSCRLDDLHALLSAFFASIPYSSNQDERVLNFESHYHYTLYLIFRLLSCYTIMTEKQNSRGRADIIVENNDYVYIFEFKLDGSAQEALSRLTSKAMPNHTLPTPADC